MAGFALFSEGVVLLARRDACCSSYVHFWWRAWHFWGILRSKTLFKRDRCETSDTFSFAWPAWYRVKVRSAFGSHFAWQAQYFVNLDDVLKGSKSLVL